jgi:arachidonate 15-lipoxygenase
MTSLKGLWNFLRRWFLHLFHWNSLKAKRKRYKFGPVSTSPDKDTLPGMNVQNNGRGHIPFEQLPSLDWLLKLADVLLKVFENHRGRSDDADGEAVRLGDMRKLQDLTAAPAPDAAKLLLQLQTTVKTVAEQNSARDLPMTWPQQLSEYNELFSSSDKGIPLPDVSEYFQPRPGNEGYFDDQFFANLRTAGFNPMVIEGLITIPPEFAVAQFDDADYRRAGGTGFSGDTLAAAAGDNRLYVCDYSKVSSLIATPPNLGGNFPNDTQKFLSAPKAWFALPPSASEANPASLRPIAIELAAGGVLFSPNDPNDSDFGLAWTQAKYVVNSSDASYHELISHLGQTHLVMEPVAICTERNLREGHELYKLLVPHVEGTIFINNAAVGGLIAAEGEIDELLASTITLDQKLAVQARGIDGNGYFNFNERFVPTELANRNVMSKKLIFPYRDDALEVWAAIHQWVSDYVDVYYQKDAHVASDVELQAWAKELISPTGGQLQGFGEATGSNDDIIIKTRSYLIDALSLLLFTGSAQHAAVNFPQAHIMLYAPAVAIAIYGDAPTAIPSNVPTYSPDGTTPGMLTPDTVAKMQVGFLALLGGVYYTQLGQYRPDHFDKKITDGPLRIFQNSLSTISIRIKDDNGDNQKRPLPYPYLNPEKIPQSINI